VGNVEEKKASKYQKIFIGGGLGDITASAEKS